MAAEMIGNPPRPDPLHRIVLDSSIYKLHSGRSHGGDSECLHDWYQDEEDGQWHCQRCGRIVQFERWAD